MNAFIWFSKCDCGFNKASSSSSWFSRLVLSKLKLPVRWLRRMVLLWRLTWNSYEMLKTFLKFSFFIRKTASQKISISFLLNFLWKLLDPVSGLCERIEVNLDLTEPNLVPLESHVCVSFVSRLFIAKPRCEGFLYSSKFIADENTRVLVLFTRRVGFGDR